MAKYIIGTVAVGLEQDEEAFSQAEFEKELRARDADQLDGRLKLFRPHEGLKKLRENRGLTQEMVSKAAGVTRRSYQFYESGQKPIPSSVLSRLAATYDIDLHELFTGDAHSANLQVRSDTAKLAADVAVRLTVRFKENPMRLDEMLRIAMEVARSYPPGTSVKNVDLYEAILIVTGEKYVQRERSFREVEDMG